MHYIFANLDRREYIRPIALGAPQVQSKHAIANTAFDLYTGWLVYILRILEHRADRVEENADEIPNWAGHRIAFIRADDPNADLVEREDEQAAEEFAASGTTSYEYVRRHFTDITDDLQWWLPDDNLMDLYFASMTKGEKFCHINFSEFTLEDVRDGMARAAQLGSYVFNSYTNWLLDGTPLKQDVRDYVTAKGARLVADPHRAIAG